MRLLAAVAIVVLGCGGDGGDGADAGGGACVDATPGVEVQVAVTCTSLSPCAFTSPEVRINFPVTGLMAYPVPLSSFDGANRATVRVAYPENAGTGQAIVAFLADAEAPFHIHGEATFDSYPPGCVRVDVAAADVQ